MYHCCSLPSLLLLFCRSVCTFFFSFFVLSFLRFPSHTPFNWCDTAIKRAIYFHFTFGYPRQSTSFNEFNTLFFFHFVKLLKLSYSRNRFLDLLLTAPPPLLCRCFCCCCCCKVINKLLVKSGKSINVNSHKMSKSKASSKHSRYFLFVWIENKNYLVFHFTQSVNDKQIVKLNNSFELICHFVSSENLNAIYLIFNHCQFSCQFTGHKILPIEFEPFFAHCHHEYRKVLTVEAVKILHDVANYSIICIVYTITGGQLNNVYKQAAKTCTKIESICVMLSF